MIGGSPPAAVEESLGRLGSNIRTARLRRTLSHSELAERMGVSRFVIADIERGKPTTGVATCLGALWVLGLLDHMREVADPDRDDEGKTLERALPEEGRPPSGAERRPLSASATSTSCCQAQRRCVPGRAAPGGLLEWPFAFDDDASQVAAVAWIVAVGVVEAAAIVPDRQGLRFPAQPACEFGDDGVPPETAQQREALLLRSSLEAGGEGVIGVERLGARDRVRAADGVQDLVELDFGVEDGRRRVAGHFLIDRRGAIPQRRGIDAAHAGEFGLQRFVERFPGEVLVGEGRVSSEGRTGDGVGHRVFRRTFEVA